MTDLFSDPRRFADIDTWRRDVVALHADGPIHRVEAPQFDPFWAVIGHDEITEIERRHDVFTNDPEPVLVSRKAIEARPFSLRTLVHLDPPDHTGLRKLGAVWFRPASLKRLTDRIEELTAKAIGRMEAAGGECDFAADIANPYPLEAILEILGLPESDYGRMLRYTQEMFGREDPDLRRAGPSTEVFAEVVNEMMAYFAEIAADRRAHPTDDLASAIANGIVDGEPLSEFDVRCYYLIVATAGHDTTASAMAGGLLALAERPDQLARLQDDPGLLNNAVEEMLRWTAPARHFMRTARIDTEIAGQHVRAGDWVYLSYLGANVDPRVFADPLRFDVARAGADRHLTFGHGVHFCLGAQLARMELRSLFAALVPRLDSIEIAGDVAHSQTTATGGVKRLPIRYRLRDTDTRVQADTGVVADAPNPEGNHP